MQHTAYIAGREGGEMDGEQGSGVMQKKHTRVVLGIPKPANCYKMLSCWNCSLYSLYCIVLSLLPTGHSSPVYLAS
jgi:hypothetical protein